MQREVELSTGGVARRERVLLAIAGAFVAAAAGMLALAGLRFTPAHAALVVGAWVLVFGALHVAFNHWLPGRDPFLLPVAALLTGWGLVLIGRLAAGFLVRQVIWLAISALALMALVRYRNDLRWLRRFRYTWLFGGLLMLAITLIFGVNPSGYGPRLWLSVFGAYLQPSEPLKLLMVIFLASYLAERRELIITERWRLGRWRLPPLACVGPLLAMLGLAMLILARQQDLGAAMLYFFTFLAMLYIATGQWSYALVGLAVFALVSVVGYTLSDHVALRVDGWLNPWPQAADRAFQIVQSLLAFSAGGLFGQGLGLGNPTYIPAVHTDFVFAAVAEEFGLLGATGVVALVAALMLRGFRSALHARRPFECLLAAGLSAGMAIQAWVIMAGSVRVAPITGVTLPFMSYGGSSLLTSFLSLGLILCISDRAPATVPTTTLPVTLPRRPMRRSLLRTASVLSAGLTVVALAAGWWAVPQASALQARPDDPRRVLYEERIVRGDIVDRNGVLLAGVEMLPDGAVQRRYPVPEAAPALGYSTLRYGTGGIEAALDAELRGEANRTPWEQAWDDLLHQPPQGSAVRLTLDFSLQREAQQALAGHAGAVVLMDATTGDILALASSPSYNPEQLEQNWDALRDSPDAPLLNRATQGLYQPGTALQIVILAEALSLGMIDLQAEAPQAADTVAVDGAQLACRTAPGEGASWGEAYAAACPAPFAALGATLGAEGLAAAVARWRLDAPPPFEIPTAAADWTAPAADAPAALADEAIGQGALVVSPLQMALIAGTLANGGTMPAPRLVDAIQQEGGWQHVSAIGSPLRVVSAVQARLLLQALTSVATGVAGHGGSAIAGRDQPPHAWFLGTTDGASTGPYVVAVLVERSPDPDRAIQIGASLLQSAAATR